MRAPRARTDDAPEAVVLARDIAYLARYGHLSRGDIGRMTARQFRRALGAVAYWVAVEAGGEEAL